MRAISGKTHIPLGIRDKNIYVGIDDIREELQDENGWMATSWTEMSILSGVRNLAEVAERYKLKEKGGAHPFYSSYKWNLQSMY